MPVAILQGADDQYGTMRQVEIAQEDATARSMSRSIADAGHSPHREAPDETLAAIADFAAAVLARTGPWRPETPCDR